MEIKKIYDMFENVGCLTFATIDEDYPETRIAHFLTYDERGLYFMTMNTKPFYKQLKQTGKVSVCGLCANTQVEHTKDGNLKFDDGYFIRISGDIEEVSIEELIEKNDSRFDYTIEDHKRYPAIRIFVVYRAKGEIFDYDFEKIKRSHKLERERFSYGGFPIIKAGLSIDSNICIGCGKCKKVCTFNAIDKIEECYKINSIRCDECGNCYTECPVGAVISKGM